ncbi:Mu transposase C-terminal domain-containing protein [Kordiimonas sp.]|uniref:Mu transposase C-terminal domain-containing protein n=1 Tax=Kordiimonas sp. TaxID=1970157 RepID=UPI003A92D331
MSKFSIEAGLKFLKEGQPHVVISREHDTVIVEDVVTGKREVLSAAEMEVEFLQGGLQVLVDSQEQPTADVPATDMLGDADRSEFNRRCRYVTKLVELSLGKSYKKYLSQAIAETAVELNDPRPPSESTLYKWLARWRSGGENLAALAPRTNKRGVREIGLRKDARRVLQAVLEEHYLKLERPTLVSVMPRVAEAFDKYNGGLEEAEHCRIPSLSTVYRFVKAMDPYTVVLRRFGKHAADNEFRHIGIGPTVKAPLDVVRIDHTPLDIQVLSPIDNIVARPTLTMATDAYSRMPLGFYVGFASPGYETLMLCLRSAILPKEDVLKQYPFIQGSWPCYGVPRMVSFDNGMEFHSSHLKDTCNMLGISIMFSPVRTPQNNGIAERFFGTINKGLLTLLKGKTFSNFIEKGDYDPVANAAIPYKVFEAVLYKWIVDVFCRKFHTGIQDFPIEVWEKGIQETPVSLPVKQKDLLILLSEVKYRTLTNKGIEIDTIRYNSQELNLYFRRLGRKTKVKVKIDPLDLGLAHVFDAESETFISVPSLKVEYRGLSKWQHKVARRLVMLKKKQGEKKYNINDALREIGRYVEEHSVKGKKKSHKPIARYASYGSEKATFKGAPKPSHPSKPEELNFDVEDMDISDLLEAAAQAGWGDLNEGEE